jgi:hypothetical protein
MLNSVVVKAPKLRSRLDFIKRAVEGGFYEEAEQMGMKVVDFLQRKTPRSSGVGSQKGEHIADGWELHTIGGKAKSGRGLLMVVFNRFTTTKAGKILSRARLSTTDLGGGRSKSDYTLMHILEYGSRPHRIFANKKKLRFMGSGGEWVFTEMVDHPGTAPNGMIRLARAYAAQWLSEFKERWCRKLGAGSM